LKITLLGGDMRLLRLSFLGKANGLRNSNKTIRSYFSFEETNTKTPKYKQIVEQTTHLPVDSEFHLPEAHDRLLYHSL